MNRFEELENYVEYLNNIFLFAKYGPSYPDWAWREPSNNVTHNLAMSLYNIQGFRWIDASGPNLLKNEERSNYLSLRIIEIFLEVIEEACTQHFRRDLQYIFNPRNQRFAFRDHVFVQSDHCLCTRPPRNDRRCYAGREIRGLREPKLFRMRLEILESDYKQFFSVNYDEARSKARIQDLRVSKHHIIPRALIRAFLKVWLLDNDERVVSSTNPIFHGCGRIIYERLKHSIKKIIIYQLAKTNDRTGVDWINYDYKALSNDDILYSYLEGWFIESSGGNIFLGPENRGPLDPSVGLEYNLVNIRGFEFDCEPIVGTQRYEEMYTLFHRLYSYVVEAPKLSQFDRFITGIELCYSMFTTFERYELTTLNMDLWEERELTEEELSRLNEIYRVLHRGVKYWSIKRPPRSDRTERSSEELKNPKKCYKVDEISKRRWSEFIVDSMKTSLRANGIGESISWTCHLVQLYFIYRFLSTSSSSKNPDCSIKNFDSFLYSKISKTREWQECIAHETLKEPEEWCRAWRRIMLNSNTESFDFNRKNGTRPEQFHRDTETLMRWLVSRIPIENTRESPSDVVNQNVVTMNTVCYAPKNASTMACPNVCKGKISKRDTSLYADLSYEIEWIKDTGDGKLRCQCPSDSTVTTEKSSRFWNWANRCIEGSPKYDPYHCKDLRR